MLSKSYFIWYILNIIIHTSFFYNHLPVSNFEIFFPLPESSPVCVAQFDLRSGTCQTQLQGYEEEKQLGLVNPFLERVCFWGDHLFWWC